jgi:S-adenosylmethionine decarboxylase
VVGEAGHQFSPHGYTQVYLLSESHFSIHTYPETASCHIDIFCCNPDFDVAVARQAIQERFRPAHMAEAVIRR